MLIRCRMLILVSVALLSSVGAAAQKQALVGGRFLDGLLGSPIANSVILVNGDTIEQVGTVDSLPVPDGYTAISTEGMSVLPRGYGSF